MKCTAGRGRYSDLLVITAVAAVAALIALSPHSRQLFLELNRNYGMPMAFLKFAVLASFGEMLAMRLTAGAYNRPGFGLLPKAVVWGGLGCVINGAFVLFAAGVPALLKYLALPLTNKLLVAFSTSLLMNVIFAPWFMVLHKLTDLHIAATGGSLPGFFSRSQVATLFRQVDWEVMWGFVFKKTLPFFWIPAHTITFLLPAELRVACAALLSIVLGSILAFASGSSKRQSPAAAGEQATSIAMS